MFKLHVKTIKLISSIIKQFDKDFQEYLYSKYVGRLKTSSKTIINWGIFIKNNLNENYYDDFINEILSNISTQERDKYVEIIKQSLRENSQKENENYLFEIVDGKYHICIEGSACIIYLNKENDTFVVNKKLNRFDSFSKELFNRERDILMNLYRRQLDISPNLFLNEKGQIDHNIIKFEKCEITLYDYIMSDKKIKFEDIINIFNKIDQLHRIDFLHRDLHPANLMQKNGDWFIIDFNIAKCPFKTGMISIQNHAGIIDYTDPIVYQEGLHRATVKTDIYSIGKLINFIFTKDPNNDKHLFNGIVNKCTASDHFLRYDHVYEIVNDIKKQISIT